MLYCTACKQYAQQDGPIAYREGDICPNCGQSRLIEKPSASGFNLNLGDANAISGGVNLSDSHNVHNEDKSVHNINNVSTVTHNVTQVAAQKTEMELLQEKKTLYLNECKRAYEDNVLEQAEVVVLEEYRIKIGLDKATADAILDSVRVMTERNARKTSLNPIAKTKLKILTDNLKKNEVKALMDQIDGLETLVNKYEHDELSRKYFLVLAALKPEKCISLKENSKVDSYWKSFWSYLSYIKVGKTTEAENILVSLDRFADYPEDNMTVLAVSGALMNGSNAEAKEYLNSVMGDYTPALQRFVDSIYLLLDPEMAKEMGADANTCAFYLVNFFNQEDPKERARKEAAADERARKEAEAKRKAEEEERIKVEQEARIKAEQEAKAKAEEEARIKAEQEAKAKAEEEERIKAEQEAKTKAEEEERIKAEQEAKAKAEEEAHIKAEQEAKAKTEDEELTPESVVDGLLNLNDQVYFKVFNIFSKDDEYYVCKYLVTQREWEVIMGDNPSWEKSPNYPVVNITYAEAEEFVKRINKIARKKNKREFIIPPKDLTWLGYQEECAKVIKRDATKDISDYAWHKGNSEGHLHNVGELTPINGLYDALGLVYEMCKTKKYNSYFYGAFNTISNACLDNDLSSDLKYVTERYNDLGLRLAVKL